MAEHDDASEELDGLDDLSASPAGAMPASGHVPVLPRQVVELLRPAPRRVVLDCTVGRGGHAALIAPLLQPGGRYVGLDADPANADYARSRLESLPGAGFPGVNIVHSNFAAARAVLDSLGIDRVDGLLADLGFASNQMADAARGLSFAADSPLDMRLDPTLPTTAADLVNRLPERELADVIYRYGQERLSRKIARKITEARRSSPISSTTDLAAIVRRAYPPPTWKDRSGSARRIDPATRTFMALRIAVNGELDALEQLLASMPGLVDDGGVAAVISFHSLEDRPVKRAFAGWERDGLGRRLTRKPVTADDDERAANPRSRSAKLRAFEFGDAD